MSKLTEASPAERHCEIAATFSRLIGGTTDWSAQTPVPEWRAGDVVDHLTSWLPGLMSNFGLDLPKATGDRAASFAVQTEAVQALLDDPAVANEPVSIGAMGEQPLGMVIDSFYTIDLFLHAWDLAKATGQEIELDADSAASMYAGLSAMGPALQASGQYGPPVPVPENDTPQRRLLGLIGRDPDWQSAG
jgi:uncharacterized protein (TIGR03086 family)